MCNDWRQEFILLSDVLGVSMLVDAINNRKPSGASESHGAWAVPRRRCAGTADGRRTSASTRRASRCWCAAGSSTRRASRSANAKIDVWQANDEGFYDVQQKGIQPDFNLRGVFRTGPDGRYWFKGVKPKFYPIPDDGPVGKLLARWAATPTARRICTTSSKRRGYERLMTHIFDPDDPYIHSDAVFGVKESLLAKFDQVTDPAEIGKAGFDKPFYLVNHDFILAPDMTKPCIICVAITGSLPKKADNPAVPITVAEQSKAPRRPWRRGRRSSMPMCATTMKPPSDPEKFARLMEGVARIAPG